MNQLIKFDKPKFYTMLQMSKKYPNSMYLMEFKSICDNEGLVYAISENEDSYDEICELNAMMQENGSICAICGNYWGGIGALYRFGS